MYAVIETGGKQYKVQEGDVIDIELLGLDAGQDVEFDKVLAVSNGELSVGAPYVDGAKVTGVLEENFRGKKLIAFKMKRRQGYRRKVGHRQNLSKVRITGISA
ncbi:MAG: 50S ribosomal protein L21 [Lentisphaeria bacterium]|nr:50S ribosomal protein L21 [Lentisphaeria bacterium]